MEHFSRCKSMPEAIHARTRCEVEVYAGFSTCGGSDAVGYNRSRKIARLRLNLKTMIGMILPCGGTGRKGSRCMRPACFVHGT